jgi:hypothetical protein
MRELIEEYIVLASTQRTVPVIVEDHGERMADGGWSLYLAAQKLEDARWRYQSPSRIARFYGRLGWKSTDAEIRLVGNVSSQNFTSWSVAGRASEPF